MRSRVLSVVAVLVAALALGVVGWVLTRPDFARPDGVQGRPPRLLSIITPIGWTVTGAALLWVRPRNAVGALLLFVGVCQALAQGASAYGMYGVGIAQPQWPAARWVALLGAPLWIPGLLPLINVLPAIYPAGRLPGRRWRLPVAASAAGITLLTIALAGGYNDVAPGRPPVTVTAPLPVKVGLVVLTAGCFLGGTVTIWVMSLVRLARSTSPERQQLAWLLCAVLPFFVVSFFSVSRWLFPVLTLAIPLAIAVGVLRYRMLGIEVVLRRGLVYAALTAAVIGVYLVVNAIAGSRVSHGGAIPGVLAAGLVAVGLTPLRERLQRTVDLLVYGDRRDPMRAVTRFGDSVAAAGEPEDLLPAMLRTVTNAVRAPGAAILSPDGKVLAAWGPEAEGAQLTLRFSGTDVGVLRVADRSPGERYSGGDRRLLAALAPQVAVVVRALDLAEALESERDRVVAATRAERERLRRDLHDGLGPSLSGVGLGLQALDTALDVGDESTANEILSRVRSEARIAVAEVRRILDDMRPATLDEASLSAALRRHTETIAARVPVELDIVTALPNLPPEVESAAFRIAQEALTNVVRHSDASRARLAVATADGTLRIEVTDDGCGFSACHSEGVGLGSMRHRAQALGGALEVTTGAGGTSIIATLPLAARR
jgi:signal transduction histidine kinase